jgi:fimR protein
MSKVIIVDDHILFRLGIRAAIEESFADISIIAECSSAHELLIHLKNGTKPDLILLDIIIPEIDGIEIAKIILRDYPDIKILVLTTDTSTEIVSELVDLGVNGYMSKTAAKTDLVDAIKSVLGGNPYYGKDISKIIYEVYIAGSKQEVSSDAKFDSIKETTRLTTKDIQIIEMVCRGLTAREIGDKLKISQRTVESHKSHIMEKLCFKNMVDLIKFALKNGIIS